MRRAFGHAVVAQSSHRISFSRGPTFLDIAAGARTKIMSRCVIDSLSEVTLAPRPRKMNLVSMFVL
jgi:hypothetical protein